MLKDITGKVDVVVCDGLTGNAMLKVMEGTGRFLWTTLSASTHEPGLKISFLMIRHELEA